MNIPVVPKPQICKAITGEYDLSKVRSISINFNGSEKLKFAVEKISVSLKKFVKSEIKIDFNKKQSASIEIIYDDMASFPQIKKDAIDQSYRLNVAPSLITIKAKTEQGAFYGLMSLLQVIEASEKNKINCFEIIDWPDMAFRGISDDISRGQVSTMDNFKKIIDFLARHKMNVYIPYIEDVLQFDPYPTIGVNRGALSKTEVKELVNYADKNFIEVIPAFQTLGHYENILSQDEFLELAEFPGAASLCVANENTYVFLETLMKEVFEMFPSQYFHMGADESYDVGLHKSKHLVEQSSLARVHLEHYMRIYDICKKYNKKVLMYSDIPLHHLEMISELPKDVIIVDWHYRGSDDYPSTKIFNDAGLPYFVSPSVWNFLTTFPTNLNALPNIYYIIKSGMENGSIGMINSNWGDYGSETLKELIYYGYAWSAQCSWNFDGSDIDLFTNNFFADFFGVKDKRPANIYANLTNSLNQVMWHDIWRHPLLVPRAPSWWEARVSPVVRYSWMNLTLPETKRNIGELKNIVKRNADHLNPLNVSLAFSFYYKLKLETQVEILSYFRNPNKTNLNKALTLIDQNIAELSSLKAEFSKVWLDYYRKDNLNMIDDKFDRLTSYFEETKELIKSDFTGVAFDSIVKITSPLIKSKWIYAMNEDSSLVKKADFKINFNLTNAPESAQFQLLGDTYAEVYINGEYVEKVYARRSLSLLVDYRRIKYFDAAKYLKAGENEILVKTQNFNQRGGAGFNLASEIIVDGKILNVDTDINSETAFVNWKVKPENGDWIAPTTRNYPYEIIAPNFKTKRTSWIER